MTRFVEGEDRTQSTLFPERLDDYIAEDSPVRVIETFRGDCAHKCSSSKAGCSEVSCSIPQFVLHGYASWRRYICVL